jgi:hypothetical protein
MLLTSTRILIINYLYQPIISNQGHNYYKI